MPYNMFSVHRVVGCFLIIILSNCSMSEDKNILCDTESGICSPGKDSKNINREGNIAADKSNIKLVYYYDALCGWCYGFSPVMSKIENKYSDKLDIKVISGGLFLGSRAGRVNVVAPHIKAGAYKSVELRTGVKFGKPFLDDVFGNGDMILNSLPPTIALNIVKEKYPDQEVQFAKMLLLAVYFDGIDPTDIESLANYAVKIGFDREDFVTKMKIQKYESAAEIEFELFRSSQYAGMPALVLVKENKEHLIAHGYMNFEEIDKKLESYVF